MYFCLRGEGKPQQDEKHHENRKENATSPPSDVAHVYSPPTPCCSLTLGPHISSVPSLPRVRKAYPPATSKVLHVVRAGPRGASAAVRQDEPLGEPGRVLEAGPEQLHQLRPRVEVLRRVDLDLDQAQLVARRDDREEVLQQGGLQVLPLLLQKIWKQSSSAPVYLSS